jgi:NitT/TauT family transport system permease protein
MTGVRQISRAHFEVAESYGASPARVLARVVLPGSLPMVLAGLRLAANIALVTVIAVEMISTDLGLGARVWLSWQVLRTEQLYATLLAIGLLGIALNAGLQWLERRLVPWSDR